MLESYFLFKQMTSYTTKARGMPSLSVKVVSWEITHPKSLNMSSLFKGLSREKSAVSGWEQGARTEKKGLQGGVRGTLGEKGVLGSHQHFSAKRGACEGKAEAPFPAFGWYHVKLSASSLFLLRGFVSHANSGSGPNSSGQALHPNWQEQEKEGGGGFRWEGVQGYSKRGVQWACPECQFFQATDVMPVPTVGEQRRDQGAPFSCPPPQSLFPGWMNLSEAATHCVP